jgi:hypothetical protein
VLVLYYTKQCRKSRGDEWPRATNGPGKRMAQGNEWPRATNVLDGFDCGPKNGTLVTIQKSLVRWSLAGQFHPERRHGGASTACMRGYLHRCFEQLRRINNLAPCGKFLTCLA